MSPSTDQIANLSLASHIRSNKDTPATQSFAKQQQRSFSWSHYNSRQASDPSFLSRPAKEQRSVSHTKRQYRKLGSFDGTSNISKLTGEDLGSQAKPDLLHNIQIAEELPREKRGASAQAHTTHFECDVPQKKCIEINITFGAGQAIDTAPCQNTIFGIEKDALPLPDTIAAASAPSSPTSPKEIHDGLDLRQARSSRGGTVRRRKMRTVSEDDYIVARGANPRTGVVTPSIYSGSSSGDERESSSVGEMSQLAKWRLKGDQWVSLGFDEPTPFPSPPDERSRGRLRIPPKLAQGRPSQYPMIGHRPKQTTPAKSIAAIRPQLCQPRQRSASELQKSEGNNYGSQASSLTARLSPRTYAQTGPDTVIKRKPVGTPPGKQSAKNVFASNEWAKLATERVSSNVNSVDQVPSSSMPTPRKIRFNGPEDVGKALPALPGAAEQTAKQGHAKGVSRSQEVPFPGVRRGDWIEDVPNQANWDGWCSQNNPSGRPMMPCPTYPAVRTNRRDFPAMTIPIYTKNFENQQRRANILPQNNSTCSIPSRSIPQRLYLSAQATDMEQKPMQPRSTRTSNICHPLPVQPRSQDQSKTRDDGQTPMQSDAIEGGSDVSTIPSLILPTTTATTTPQTSPDDRLVSSSWREIPSPLRSGRPKTKPPPRPTMPERAEGTQHVPQVSPGKEIPKRDKCEMTGTSDTKTSVKTTLGEGSPAGNLPLIPSNGNAARLARLKKMTAGGGTDAGQPTKDCPHCRERSTDSHPRDKPGVTNAQENPLTENIDPKADMNSQSGLLQASPEDHLACCAECCAVGCHGSCLGHRASFTNSSTSGVASGIDAMKEAFRNSMRLSRRFRVRTSAGGSCETETEETAELETPLSWEMAGPVSLGMPLTMSPQSFKSGSHAEPRSQGQRIASNASGSSIKTLDIPTNTGIGAVIEALMVPFGALRMWLKKHPQLLALMQVVVMKLVDMSKHVFDTAGKAYRIAYVYSKTGRLSAGKHNSVSGFASDCVKAVTYCLILGTVAMMVGRVLAVITGAAGWVIWVLRWVAWIFKAVGLGVLW